MTLPMRVPAGVMVEEDADELRVFVRRDMLHLDADALHDRLHHWMLREVDPRIPAASAGVSFRNASPADPFEESTLDAQEGWLGLEPTLALDLRAARPGDRARFEALLPTFLALLEKSGRPTGFRTPDVGNME